MRYLQTLKFKLLGRKVVAVDRCVQDGEDYGCRMTAYFYNKITLITKVEYWWNGKWRKSRRKGSK